MDVVDQVQGDVFCVDEASAGADEETRHEEFLRRRAAVEVVHAAGAAEDAHALRQDDVARVVVAQALAQGDGVDAFAADGFVRDEEAPVGHPGLAGNGVELIRFVQLLARVEVAVVRGNQEAIDVAAPRKALDELEEFGQGLVRRLEDGVLRLEGFAGNVNAVVVNVDDFLPGGEGFQFRRLQGNEVVVGDGRGVGILALQELFTLSRRGTRFAVDEDFRRRIARHVQGVVRQELCHAEGGDGRQRGHTDPFFNGAVLVFPEASGQFLGGFQTEGVGDDDGHFFLDGPHFVLIEIALARHDFLKVVTAPSIVPVSQERFQEGVLVEVLDQGPQGVELARVFAVQCVIGREEMAVLRIDAVVFTVVGFGQLLERRPRFVVLEVQ